MTSRRVRVLVDCRMADWTGVGRYTRGLVRALAARDDLELACVVATGEQPPATGVASVEAATAVFSLGGMRELSQIARSSRPDVTHCLHFPTPLPATHPLVVTMHDLTPLLVEGTMPSFARRMAYRALNARAARVADLVLTPSQHTATDVEHIFSSARGKTRVTGEGADDFSAGPLGRLPAIAQAGPYLFSMGSTRAHKDLPTLLRAFASLSDAHPEMRLLLAGPGDEGYVDSAMRGLSAGARERVRFTGGLDDSALRALYANATAFVFPSKYEGFGLPPLEAMAMGAPVIAADAASLPEVVGEAGLLFPPGDAAALAASISRVLGDAELRRALAESGRARAAEMTWAAAAERTVSAYREVSR